MILARRSFRHKEDNLADILQDTDMKQEYYHRSPTSGGGGSDAPLAKLLRIAKQLEALIETESDALKNQESVNFAEANIRKNRELLELEATIMACINAGIPEDKIRACLSGLREKLAQNMALLRTHVRAVREVSSIISNAIAEAESDGTYSMAVRYRSNL